MRPGHVRMVVYPWERGSPSKMKELLIYLSCCIIHSKCGNILLAFIKLGWWVFVMLVSRLFCWFEFRLLKTNILPRKRLGNWENNPSFLHLGFFSRHLLLFNASDTQGGIPSATEDFPSLNTIEKHQFSVQSPETESSVDISRDFRMCINTFHHYLRLPPPPHFLCI